MQKEIIEGFQLSPQQKHLWLLQKSGSSLKYSTQCAVRIEGNLDLKALKIALEQVVSRHEILHTTFHCLPGMSIPLQVVAQRNSDLSWEIKQHLNNLTVEEQEVELNQLFHDAIQQPFDLKKGPLLRASLVPLAPHQYELLLGLPAMNGDAGTLKNLVRELSYSYAACVLDEKLEHEPLQYADIAQWLNELLESENQEASQNYWRQIPFSSLLTLKLPLAHLFSETSDFEPHSLSWILHPELTKKLEILAQKYETSISTFCLACWQILLWRVTEQPDLIVGVAFDGRNYKELEEALGLLTKYLPIIGHFEGHESFNKVLARLDESIQEASEWQESFTWEKLDSSNLSFFPICFEFENLSSKFHVEGVYFTINKQYTCPERFKIKLCCTRLDDSIKATFYYDANIVSAESIQRLSEQFQTVLVSAINQPEAAIAHLEILSPQERQRLLVEFNQTTAPYPYEQCIHQLFEEQVEQTPDNIALVYENQQLTYAELNAQANKIARYLQGLGVKPEVLVGVCITRSLSMLVGLLGILKAGGAYVPLDPSLPTQRLAFVINDTQMPVLLTQKHLAARLPTEGTKIVCLDADWESIVLHDTQNPTSPVTPENLAYVIYTSGSTGKPKGTLIPHRGLVNYLSWCTQAYAVEQGKGSPVHSSIAFDMTITGLFSPLLVGRTVELLPETVGVESLCRSLHENCNYSLVKLTPAQLTLLGQQFSAQEAAGRTQALIIGGENLLAEHIAFWQNAAPDTALINEYGPTETVVGCCVYQVPKGQHHSGVIPIGRPIANTQLYVLDRYLQPMPVGVPGELYIGGLGLARGYLNRPDLTADKFIPDPFSNQPGARLYRTGDLAYHRPDGNLELIGRIDHQVKLRGFRVELGEVEAAVSEHPAVREAVVLAREDRPGDQRLVAYVVPYPRQTLDLLHEYLEPHPNPPLTKEELKGVIPIQARSLLTTNELKAFLKAKLPEYMVPDAFVMLDALPLTLHGKVDRRSLRAPESDRPELDVAYIMPKTELEQTIAAIWQDVLHLETVGIHDNFFDLGGHSLLMLQVHCQLQERLKQNLTAIELFEHPTIARLAKHLSQENIEQPSFDPIRDRVKKQKEALNRKKQLLKEGGKN
ncbi:MAG TPA: non-ribosomal peptide synthetase [Cyanobacteria bacterium UBA8543]|nr:non-ribosomal peptide synthetase [Cyanobacteria bacterium UBA8543]